MEGKGIKDLLLTPLEIMSIGPPIPLVHAIRLWVELFQNYNQKTITLITYCFNKYFSPTDVSTTSFP